ncbi:MAG: GNAT family N-acetyltransferase [Chloroflexota bacterium]
MHIRVADPAQDFPRVVELLNAVESEPIRLQQLHDWHNHMPPGRIVRRTVALDDSGQVTGYAFVAHETWMPDGHFNLWVTCDARLRGHGIGAALYRDALAYVDDLSPVYLGSEVREQGTAGLAFAQRRGFHVSRCQFESLLDLETFDERPFLPLLEQLQAQGLRFFSLEQAGDTPENRRKLYHVNATTALDIPGTQVAFMTYEDFEQLICGAIWFNPAGQLFAAYGSPAQAEWVGMAAVSLSPDTGGAYNLMTGVLREQRGRKIAQALKLLAARYARANGATYIRTDNDSTNAPMLAVNRKFGYQPRPGKYILAQDLAK